MKNLEGKIALITGSTRGIGKSIALEFAFQGAIVLLHGSKESNVAISTCNEVLKISPKSKIYYANITDIGEVTSMTQAIQKEFNHLDILINNAGIVKNTMFFNISIEEWDSVMKVNAYGTFYITKSFVPLIMNAKKGKIINMSSISGQVGEYGQTNYCAAKAAILGFTRALSKEMAKHNITVNAICPAVIESDAVNNIPKKYRDQLMQKIPLGRAGKKEEVAKLAAFLSSDDADYITGQAISINGGMS